MCPHFLATRDGELFAWGTNNQGQLGVGDYIERKDPTLVIFPEE